MYKKYLIDKSIPWYGKYKIFTSERARISQTFLRPEADTAHVYVNAMTHNNGPCNTKYFFNREKYTGTYMNSSFTEPLSHHKYLAESAKHDDKAFVLEKEKYFFIFAFKGFTIEFYKARLNGLVILKTHSHISENILLPPYIPVIKEVTDDEYFMERNLSSLLYFNSETNVKFPRRIDC